MQKAGWKMRQKVMNEKRKAGFFGRREAPIFFVFQRKGCREQVGGEENACL